tara:strand:- start:48 stop:548 length:501 start_codon:yes stop_codon:yes gene_type:complete
MIQVYDNILKPEETTLLCNNFLNKDCPYYLKIGQTDIDDRINFTHALQDRKSQEITSQKYHDVMKIVTRLCKTLNIKLKKTLRASANLTLPQSPSRGAIHVDHPFYYMQCIIYLTDGGATHIFNDKNKVIKKIVSKKARVLFFDNQSHAVVHSKKNARVIVVVTFI